MFDVVVDETDVNTIAVFDVVVDETDVISNIAVVDVLTIESGSSGLPPDPQQIATAVSDYLTDNPILPPQTGQAGNVLSTNGSAPSWMNITPPVTLTLLLDNALV